MAFSENLVQILNQKGISKNKLLTDLRLSKNSIVDWSNRGTVPNATVVSRIADYLSVSIETLLEQPQKESLYFSSNLKYLRMCKNIPQSVVSEKFSLGPNTIGSYERGDREPTLNCLAGLAKFYEVSIDDLLLKDLRPPGSILGKNLGYLRKRKNCSQSEIAKLLQVTQRCISFYESGKREPSLQNLLSLSEFYGVTVDDLIKKDLSEGGK